ncbi:hypothetical protein [Enterococcus sp. CSURQ0835]|uniref:hypothetical protein n=1 Tax=Enterococcus sp. CSURQ0835 TaxID=2681394 RepID=UPI00135B3FA1|nr:hypothetical protein [Enterococcus sp. CSURQ0835]
MSQNKQRNHFCQPFLFGGLMSLGVGFPFYRVLFSTRAWYWKVAAFCLLLVTIAIGGKVRYMTVCAKIEYLWGKISFRSSQIGDDHRL